VAGIGAVSARARSAWLAAFVLCTVFAFPQRIGERMLDGGLFLAWCVPACLVLGIQGLTPRRAAARAFFASLLAHALILHWLFIVTVTFGQASPVLGVCAPIAIGAYIALFSAVFALVWARWAQRGRAGPFLGACLWVVLDYLRGYVLSGFPWAVLGYAQHENFWLLPLASATGVYGLSFAVALGGLGLAEFALHTSGAGVRWRRAGAALFGVLLAHAAGWFLGSEPLSPPVATARMAALQGNISQGVKWSPEWAEETLEIYFDLTRRAAEQGAQVILWPETAVPGSIETDPELRERLADLAQEVSATLVLGAVGVEFDGEQPLFYDSAYVVTAEGEYSDRYDKTHLVPFGEYIPLRRLFGFFLQAVARGMAPDSVTAGPAPRSVWIDFPGTGALPVGIPICYELLFPHSVRALAVESASALLAMTNDAWYGSTGALDQFLAMTAVRSAETRLWTLRAANTGISARIDPKGRVREQTAIFERELLVAEIPLFAAPGGHSLYARAGDVFAGACWIAVLSGGLWAAFARRKIAVMPGTEETPETERVPAAEGAVPKTEETLIPVTVTEGVSLYDGTNEHSGARPE